jgi:hypothetical protein
MSVQKSIGFYLRKIGIIVFILVIVGYAAFQSRKLFEGPDIAINSPANGATLTSSLIQVEGVAQNIKSLTLNDQTLFTDEAGNFKDTLLLYPGYNIIKLEGTDKFGKTLVKTIELVSKPNS